MAEHGEAGASGYVEEAKTLVKEFDILPDHLVLRAIRVAARNGNFAIVDGIVETHVKIRKLKKYPTISDEAIVNAILEEVAGGTDG